MGDTPSSKAAQSKELRAAIKVLVKSFAEKRLRDDGVEEWRIDTLVEDALLEVDAVVTAMFSKARALQQHKKQPTTAALRKACEQLGTKPPTRARKIDAQDARKRYRRLAAKYHPDRNQSPEAVEQFNAIHEAWTLVSTYLEMEQDHG